MYDPSIPPISFNQWRLSHSSPPLPLNPMTDPTPTPHRATPEQWERIRQLSSNPYFDVQSVAFHSAIRAFANAMLQHNDSIKSEANFLTELRARVEALEAQQQDQPPVPAVDADANLVDQVSEAIEAAPRDAWEPEARAAIRVVARWLLEKGWDNAGHLLEQEAGR